MPPPRSALLAAVVLLLATTPARAEQPQLIVPDKVSDFELPDAIRLSLPAGAEGVLVWKAGGRRGEPITIKPGMPALEIPINLDLKAHPKGKKNTIEALVLASDGHVSHRLRAKVIVYAEIPHRRAAGIFYFPSDDPALQIPRMIRGDLGGRAGFDQALVACVEAGERKLVGANQLAQLARFGRGRLRAVIDVHVLANEASLQGSPSFAEVAIRAMASSEHATLIEGWYICDEPFARSHPDKPIPLDIRDALKLLAVVKRVASEEGCSPRIYADYGSLGALLKKGGDLHNGNSTHFTDDPMMREGFWWGGRWVYEASDPELTRGRTIYRSFGAFGEDVTLINFYGDGTALEHWLPKIAREVALSRVHIVTGYDVNTDAGAPGRDAWVQRIRQVVEVGQQAGVGGFWLWCWKTRNPGGRTYHGIGSWWESDRSDSQFPLRWARLIESVE